MTLNKFLRVQQWNTFARQWLLYDAKWQDLFDSANVISDYLKGRFKPFYEPHTKREYGDIVVAINTKDVSLPEGEWRWRMYSHHSQYAKGQTWGVAYDMHLKDPTILLYKAVYKAIHNVPLRRTLMARLYIFPDGNVPEHIMANICDQIRQVNPVYKSLESFTKEEIDTFPKITDYPEDFVIKRTLVVEK